MRRTSFIRESLDRLNNIEEEQRVIVLDEDLKGYFKNQYLKKFSERNNLTGPEPQVLKKALAMALEIAKLDPTFEGREETNAEKALNKNQGAYFDWLIRMVNKGVVTYDQLIQGGHEYFDQLRAFDGLKKRNRLPSDKKDIMQFKSLESLMDMLAEVGVQADEEGNVTHSDFKQDISDIRQGIANICHFNSVDNIPADIQNVEDVMELVGENGEWEVWAAKNKYATMIFDRWGKGANWCVGGMLGSPRNGESQAEDAEYYYTNYSKNGGTYVCFQRKDKNAARPDNKYLITLGPNGSRPDNGYSGYQFNDANNRNMGDEWSDEGQMDALADFLMKNGLVDIMKNSKFKELEALNVIDNMERLEKGEPFIYNGGKIREKWKDKIKKLEFTYDGKKYTIDTVEHPEFLNGESVNDMINYKLLAEGQPYVYSGEGEIPQKFRDAITDLVFEYEGKKYTVNAKEHPEFFNGSSAYEMFNIKELSEGKPYVYDGSKIKESLKPAIREIVFADNYDIKGSNCGFRNITDESALGIPVRAFHGCSNLEKINLPVNVTVFGLRCVDGVADDCIIVTPRYPDRNLKIYPDERQKLAKMFRFTEGGGRAFDDEGNKTTDKE